MLLAPAVVDKAWTLTVIGMGTAFAVLLILLALIALIRQFTERLAPRFGWEVIANPVAETEPPDTEMRNRALAAALAVTALLEARPEPSHPAGEGQ